MEGRNGGRLRQDPSARDRQLGPAVVTTSPSGTGAGIRLTEDNPRDAGPRGAGPQERGRRLGMALRERSRGRGQKTWGLGGRIPKVGRKGGLNVWGKIFAGSCPLVQVILAWTGGMNDS